MSCCLVKFGRWCWFGSCSPSRRHLASCCQDGRLWLTGLTAKPVQAHTTTHAGHRVLGGRGAGRLRAAARLRGAAAAGSGGGPVSSRASGGGLGQPPDCGDAGKMEPLLAHWHWLRYRAATWPCAPQSAASRQVQTNAVPRLEPVELVASLGLLHPCPACRSLWPS